MKTLINELINILTMTSSVTIPDELRRKIKQLAAFFDTSQSEIIDRAIVAFEHLHLPMNDIKDPKLLIYLAEISKQVHINDPDRKIRSEKLSKPGLAIESITPAIWGRNVDE